MTQQATTAPREQGAEMTNKPQNLPLLQKNVTDSVMLRVKQLEETGGLVFPKNYSPANQIKAAWFVLQATKDRNDRPALEVCEPSTIANALLDMVVQGLSVSKAQGYFIVYGKKLEFQRSYFGTVALAKRCGMPNEPVANVVYEGDEFEYAINTTTGLTMIVKHNQSFENIDIAKIKGAYAIVTRPDGTRQVTIMTMQQIQKAWSQGATRGKSPAHMNFTDQMCKKTVISRACKMLVNSSDDAYLFDGKRDEFDKDESLAEAREAEQTRVNTKIGTEVEYEEVVEEQNINSSSNEEATTKEQQPANTSSSLFDEGNAPY